MFKLIEKISENVPENKIITNYAYYMIFHPDIMKIRKYNKNTLFQLAIKDFSYDKDIFQIKENIFNETSLENFCRHFAGITYFDINVGLIAEFPLIIFSSYIKDNQIFLYNEDKHQYVKIHLKRVF